MTPSEIKPGMKFNHWTVIEYSHTNKHRIKYFLCQCDCGTKRKIRGTSLLQGTSKACSKQCENNIIGQTFGKWTVLKADKSNPRKYWCRCECGTERSIDKYSLLNGTSKSCGCGKNLFTGPREETIKKYESYIGKKFGKLTILDLNMSGGYYRCKCDCGKEVKVPKYNIISGNTTSCGCQRKETLHNRQEKKYKEYLGKKINYLTILDCFYKNNTFWYRCKCDCGKECTLQATKVYTHYLQSCGCIKSKAEESMAKILDSYNITYKREYKIQDCRDKQPLPFDFAFFSQEDELIGLMELNGQQHYIEQGWSTKERVEYTQKHDKIKHDFCLQNNIPLLVIPYQFYDELEKFLTSSNFWQIITKNFND